MHVATEARVVNKAEAPTGYAHCTCKLSILLLCDDQATNANTVLEDIPMAHDGALVSDFHRSKLA